MFDLSTFKVKDELNPDIWQNNTLSNPVSLKLKRIANDFLDSLEIPRRLVKDITFTGSLANYNWSKHSDIDLHILLDFSDIDDNEELVKDFFDSKRVEWNKTHDIRIKNHEVEIYVQQADEPHHSSGVFSIADNEWLTEPSKQSPQLDEREIQRKAGYIMQEIDEVNRLYQAGDYDEAFRYSEKLKSRIRDFRQCGLEEGGEFSPENIAFKALRRNGYLELLSKLKTSSYDKLMSIDEAEGGYTTAGGAGGWLPDDPSGWMQLRDRLITDYPGSEVSAAYDNDKKQLRIWKIALPKELRGQGLGSDIMDKIVDWADHVQALITLSPSTSFGATSVNRLRKFYKRFGFVENKGRNKDYSLSDTMYRKPQ